MKFVIYNFERKAWWKQNMMGYTSNQHEAGKFDPDQAAAILDQANIVRREDIAIPEHKVYFTTGHAILSYAAIMEPVHPALAVGVVVS